MKICVNIKKLKRIVFLLNLTTVLLVLNLTASVVAQSTLLPDSIRFEHINIETGLASSTVSAIIQDHEGFVWFGTTQGLNRFDGYEYLLFGKTPNDPHKDIGRNRILSLYEEDNSDILWIGTDYLIQYSTTDGTQTRYLDVSDGSGIDVIVPDHNGNLLLSGHQLGLRKFDIAKGEIVATHYFEPQENGGKSNTINDMVVSEDGLVWMATASGVYMFNPKTSQFSRPAILLGLTDLHISSIEIDTSQRIWIGSWSGLYQYDYKRSKFTSFAQDEIGFTQIHSLLVDNHDHVWIGSDKQGVSAFDPSTNQFMRYEAKDTNPYAMGGGAVIDIYEDEVESIWFSVQGYGVYRYNPNAQLFDLYLADPIDPNALGYPQVLPIVVDKENTAWIGTDGGGLYALKQGTDDFIEYRYEEEDETRLRSDSVLGMVQSSDAHLWIGSWGGGVSRFNPQTDEFTHWSVEDGLSTDNIFTLYIDTQNRLWISSWDHGVQLLDIESEQLIDDPFPVYTQWVGGDEEDPGLQNVNVMAMLEARDGTMWFGGYGGLEQYNPRTGLFRHFLANGDPNVRYEISSNTIFVLHEDKRGIIWAGTDAGLNRIDPVTGVISAYTVSDGLPDNVVVGILEDEEGDLWLSTTRGISLFRYENENFQNFSMNTGLQGEEFNRFSFGQGNGLMYFGGANGFNRFDPLKVKQASQSDTPRIELTDFSLAGESVYPNSLGRKDVLVQAINAADEITLSAEDDMFSIKFAALEYTRPEQMRYEYKLEGNDDNWVERSSDERIATYTNIESGTYLFRVRALSADGSPSPEEAHVKIVIAPHWWETEWFNVLFATGIMITLVVGYRLHLRATTDKLEIGQKEREANIYRQKNSELQQVNKKLLMLNQEKDDMLGIVAHDLRNPLGVMLMNLDLLISHHDKFSLEKRKKKLEQVEQMVRTTHKMADRLLTEGREKGITAEIEPVPITPILDELCQQYEMKAVQKQIELEQKWHTHRQIGVAADATMLRQVLDNLISNAIKYSHPSSSVLLLIEQVDSVVSIIVQDTGQGMTAEDLEHVFGRYTQLSAKPTQGEHSVGMGLYNVKTLVDAMNGEVVVTSDGRNQGCTFTVKLPRATVVNTVAPVSIPTFQAAKRPTRHRIVV